MKRSPNIINWHQEKPIAVLLQYPFKILSCISTFNHAYFITSMKQDSGSFSPNISFFYTTIKVVSVLQGYFVHNL